MQKLNTVENVLYKIYTMWENAQQNSTLVEKHVCTMLKIFYTNSYQQQLSV